MRDLRKEYTRGGLDETNLVDDPMVMLQRWFDQAIQSVDVDWLEPNAATLATASASGQVSARIVLVKGIDAQGVLFFTNYNSPKGRQLAEHPQAALVLYWPHLQRQVRIEGMVSRVSRELSCEYFHSRPRGSQISAAVSEQSSVVPNRAFLEERAAELERQLAGAEVPVPEDWGGYRLEPTEFEFWQGRENRLHDRFRYRLQADRSWHHERLAP
jgi:pyridoxamine 5'-phosphate oxidase